MTTEANLVEFLNERVRPTRETHHIQYPLVDSPAVAVLIDSVEQAMTAVILPTIGTDVLHLEIHFFVDGERSKLSDSGEAEDGCFELTLRRSVAKT